MSFLTLQIEPTQRQVAAKAALVEWNKRRAPPDHILSDCTYAEAAYVCSWSSDESLIEASHRVAASPKPPSSQRYLQVYTEKVYHRKLHIGQNPIKWLSLCQVGLALMTQSKRTRTLDLSRKTRSSLSFSVIKPKLSQKRPNSECHKPSLKRAKTQGNKRANLIAGRHHTVSQPCADLPYLPTLSQRLYFQVATLLT